VRYRLAVVTNGLHLVQRARLERSGFLPLLDGVFISQEMGVQKPTKAYFDAVLSAFGDGNPNRYLMIGDSLSADIQGGINAGLDTCWFRPAGMEPREDVPPTYTVGGYDELLALLLPYRRNSATNASLSPPFAVRNASVFPQQTLPFLPRLRYDKKQYFSVAGGNKYGSV